MTSVESRPQLKEKVAMPTSTTASLTTVSAPDHRGRVVVQISGLPYLVVLSEPDPYIDDLHDAQGIAIDAEDLAISDPEFAELHAREQALGEDRNMPRGLNPEIDALYDALRDRFEQAAVTLAKGILTVLYAYGVLSGPARDVIDRTSWYTDEYARQDSGVRAGGELRHGSRPVRIDIVTSWPAYWPSIACTDLAALYAQASKADADSRSYAAGLRAALVQVVTTESARGRDWAHGWVVDNIEH